MNKDLFFISFFFSSLSLKNKAFVQHFAMYNQGFRFNFEKVSN